MARRRRKSFLASAQRRNVRVAVCKQVRAYMSMCVWVYVRVCVCVYEENSKSQWRMTNADAYRRRGSVYKWLLAPPDTYGRQPLHSRQCIYHPVTGSFDSGLLSYPALDVRSTRSSEVIVVVVEALAVILLRWWW